MEPALPPPSLPPAKPAEPHHQSLWVLVMCLTGVDYFSSLGYQPSIAFQNAGMLAPMATVLLVLVTLFGALPVYSYVASRSHEGQGSIGMLANLMKGWPGKILVLVLLGFAATDFVITKTLSAADAAEHLLQNPLLKADGPDSGAERKQILLTMGLLVLLGAVFMRGFREVIGLAAVIVGVYLLLNVAVVGAGLLHLVEHPHRFAEWMARVDSGEWYIPDKPFDGSGWLTILLTSVLLFPKLALGLSGFETGVAVMPLIKGDPTDTRVNPVGRVRNTRKLLVAAAVIMSAFLLGSSLVMSTLIDPAELAKVDAAGNPTGADKPPADNRVLAYIAHGQHSAGQEKLAPFFGEAFGTVYDVVTVVILWFAGASAMAGLLNLVPKYLPQYGMAPEWAAALRPLVIMFTLINLLVTWIFDASVDAQGDAYATGVLVLITSAGVATVIDKYRTRPGPWFRRVAWFYVLVTVVFVYTTAAIVVEKPVGIKIAGWFIMVILLTSFYSRVRRSQELRFSGFQIPDPGTRFLWDTIRHLEISILVPHRPGRHSLEVKEATIRREHRIPAELMVVFVEVEVNDASNFLQEPILHITQEEGRFVMQVTGAASIAHILAAVALEMAKVGHPPEIHFGWTQESLLSGTMGFILFGEGNVPWLVRELMRRAEPDPDKRPMVIIAGQ